MRYSLKDLNDPFYFEHKKSTNLVPLPEMFPVVVTCAASAGLCTATVTNPTIKVISVIPNRLNFSFISSYPPALY